KRARVVVGQAGSPTPQRRTDAEMALQTGFAFKGPDPSPFLVKFPGLLRNVPSLEKAAAGRGLFSIDPERDGIVRRVPVVMVAGGEIMPALSLEMLRVGFGAQAIRVLTDEAGVEEVQTIPPRFQLPTDNTGKLW